MTDKEAVPTPWPTTAVSKAAIINPGVPLPPAEYDQALVPLYEMSAIDEFRGLLNEPLYVPLRRCRSGKSKFQKEDVLFAKITPCVQNGKSALAANLDDNMAFGSSEFYVLRPQRYTLPEYLFYFLRQRRVIQAAVDSFTGTSGRQRVPKSFWDRLQIPLPPPPVQERIVQVLRKADGIRQKRHAALELAESILPAALVAMFGHPDENTKAFPVLQLGELADIRSGVTKGRRFGARAAVEVPYLRVANVQDGFLDLSEIKTIAVLPDDVEKYRLEDGDILMTEGGDPDKLGRGCVWRGQIEGCIHQNHVFRVRTHKSMLLPEYLAALLRTPYAKHYFLSCAKRTSNLASVNSTQVKAFAVPLPSIRLQRKFVSAVEQWRQMEEKLVETRTRSESVFRSLLQRAFSSELTAEWENENATMISELTAFHERLPRLMLLALLVERDKHWGAQPPRRKELLLTALMKYAFLMQKEGKATREVFQFMPYHYGPFAKELYAELERLEEEGYVTVEGTDGEEKKRISVRAVDKAAEALRELPEELKEDAAEIVEAYGGLEHRTLLRTVYEKYPAYARKSRLRGRT